MNMYLNGRILYILRELEKQKTLSLSCPNVRPYLKIINFLLKENLVKVVKVGYYIDSDNYFPMIVKISERGLDLIKEELGEF